MKWRKCKTLSPYYLIILYDNIMKIFKKFKHNKVRKEKFDSWDLRSEL